MSDIAGLPEDYAFSAEQLEQLRQKFAERLSSEDRDKFESLPVGDQVEISAEAWARYAASRTKESGETGDKPQNGAQGGGQNGAQGGQQAAAGGGGGPTLVNGTGAKGGDDESSSGIDSQIDKLEKEIEKLKEEISELEAKTGSDEDAAAQLKSKRIELTTKQDQLMLLKEQQQKEGKA